MREPLGVTVYGRYGTAPKISVRLDFSTGDLLQGEARLQCISLGYSSQGCTVKLSEQSPKKDCTGTLSWFLPWDREPAPALAAAIAAFQVALKTFQSSISKEVETLEAEGE